MKQGFFIGIGLILGVLSSSSIAEAVDTQKDDKASALIQKIEGVYKKRFKNGNAEGNSYESEDILEIVSVSDDEIYFKAHLEFFNGGLCSLYGLAKYQDDATFLFKGEDMGEPFGKCQLKIVPTAETVTFKDGVNGAPGCDSYACGSRGSFNGSEFKMTQRRPIRYMEILKNSQDYKNSVKNLKKE